MTSGKRLTGAVYALADGGANGLRLAMLLGGGVQIACAASAWHSMRERRDRRRPASSMARCEST